MASLQHIGNKQTVAAESKPDDIRDAGNTVNDKS